MEVIDFLVARALDIGIAANLIVVVLREHYG